MDKMNLIINLIIAVLVLVGFFGYFARVAGLYKEGGLLNRLWKKIVSVLEKKKDNSSKEKNNN